MFFVFCSLFYLTITTAAETTFLLFSSFHVKPNESSDAINKTQCTVQAVKSDGSCYLLSALHCLGDGRTKSYIEIAPSLYKEITVQKTSLDLDLVLYETPREFQALQNACDNLNEIKPIGFKNLKGQLLNPEVSDHLQANGVIGSRLWTEYSFSENWSEASASSRISLLDMGNAKWVHLKNIQIFPGMSGGTVSTRDGQAVGMITGYVYLQDLALAVPYDAILDFIKNKNSKSSSLKTSTYRYGYLSPAAENLYSGGGENEHGKWGENEHGKGGENEHGKGGNEAKLNFRILPDYVLRRSQEPDEGIAYPENPTQRLLSVGGYQIDGNDDYLKIKRDPSFGRMEKIFRPNSINSSLDPKIREKTMGRLSEVYHTLYRQNSVEHLIYRINPKHPMGWSLAYYLSLPFDINVEKKNLYFSSAIHGAFKRGRAWEGFLNGDVIASSYMKDDFSFDLSYSKDFSKIFLKGKWLRFRSWEGEKLNGMDFVCENNNYLKLICRSRNNFGANLSLSKEYLGRGPLKFRLTFFEDVGTEILLHHYYGVLDPSASPKEMRERFFDLFPDFGAKR